MEPCQRVQVYNATARYAGLEPSRASSHGVLQKSLAETSRGLRNVRAILWFYPTRDCKRADAVKPSSKHTESSAGPSVHVQEPDVIHVCNGGLGGINHVVTLLVDEMAEMGIGSSLVLYQRGPLAKGGLADYSRALGVEVLTKAPGLDLRGVVTIVRVIFCSKARIAVFHDPFRALAYVGLKRVLRRKSPQKVIVVSHSAPIIVNSVRRLASWASAACCSAIVRVGPNCIPRTDSWWSRLVSSKTYTIPNGVRISDNNFSTSRLPAMQNLKSEGAILLGMGARMAPVKDFDTLIHAAAMVRATEANRKVRLCLAGDGPDSARVESLARAKLGDGVLLLGSLSREEMASFYGLLDIYVQSSRGESDVSTSVLNAMASECCIVATRVPGIVDNLGRYDRACVRLVAGGSVTDLSHVLAELIRDDKLRSAMGCRARALAADRYSSQRMASEYVSLFAELDPDGPWRQVRKSTNETSHEAM